MGLHQPLMNMLTRNIARIWPGMTGLSTKHDHYLDYGWPERLTFDQFHRMYCRNGLAASAIDKTIGKTWETHPELWESEEPAESELEGQIRERFDDRRIWQSLMNTDRRAMVGCYAGAILLLADNKKLSEPVDRVPGGIEGLVGILPAWEGQLTVSEWDNVQTSPTYGQPKMFQFSELSMDRKSGVSREVAIHPDRVIIWSEDGTVDGRSTLEPGYNDLIDAEKVKGAGGEGFWKTARGAPVIEAPEGMSQQDVMRTFGVSTAAEAIDKINEQLDDFQQGFDKGLMLGGMTAKPMQISLPQPEQFFNLPVKSFAASMQIPVRILIGNETGERASTEDARDWAMTCMSRRTNICLPLLNEFVNRLVAWGILPVRDWTIGWADLTEATASEKIDRATKMSAINAQTLPGDVPAFLPDEIREAAGYEPMEQIDLERVQGRPDAPGNTGEDGVMVE